MSRCGSHDLSHDLSRTLSHDLSHPLSRFIALSLSRPLPYHLSHDLSCGSLALALTRCDQVEQDFELAAGEYEHHNNLLKTELPAFLQMATRFIDPLFHSFYYMQ